MATVRPRALPENIYPSALDVVPSDDGYTVTAVTWRNGVSAALADRNLIGLTLLATLTTTSGISYQVTDIGASYRALYIEVDGVRFNASDHLVVALSSTNGAAYETGQPASPTVGPDNTIAGVVQVGNLRSNLSNGKTLLSAVATDADAVQSQLVHRLSTSTAAPSDAIRFTANGGSTFDAGTIRVYGVR